MQSVMQSPLLNRSVRWVFVAVAALPLLCQTAVAQEASSADLFQNSQSGDGRSSDPFSGNGSGQAGSMFDLMHRAVLGTTRTQQEFLQDQRDSLSTEAENFRMRQQQRLQQSQPATAAPAAPLPEVNPR
jgi:hypothetical protein